MSEADHASPKPAKTSGSPYAIDHVFMLVAPKGTREMEKLAKGGLTKSWSRPHVGMGSANIFLCFDNAFLELVWFDSEAEALTSPVGKRLVERWIKRDQGAMTFGIAVRAPASDHPMPFEGWRFKPPTASDMVNTVTIANSSDDLGQPFLFRSQRSIPPSAWTDGLAGERQRPGGFGSITRWTLHMPTGVAPGPDLLMLEAQGLLTLGPPLGPKTAWTIEASRVDGAPPRRFRLPDCTWED